MPKRISKAAAFAAMICLPVISAHASRLGHPGVSTRGATGPQRQWNLISDPAEVTAGSDTTIYTTNATLSEVDPVFPYQLQTVTVELTDGEGTFYNTYSPSFVINSGTPANKVGDVIIDPTTFDGAHETGRVQVSWNIMSGQKPPSSLDDNTDTLHFNSAAGSTSPYATFTDTMVDYSSLYYYENAPAPDYYTGIGLNGKPFTYSSDPNSPYYVSNFDTQTITLYQGSPAAVPASALTSPSSPANINNVDAIPEPSMLGLAGIMAAAGLLRRRRAGASSPTP